MRKSTKNKLTKAIHVILIILTVFVALIASIYAAIRDVTVQSMIARSAAGFVSQKLNTDVKIKTFYVTPNLEIHLRGLQIKDLEKYPMFEIGEFRTKLALSEGISLRLREVYLNDALASLVTYEGNEMSNLAEILSQLPKKENDPDEKSDFNLRVDKVNIENTHFVLWNQNKADPTRKRMDYKHIDVDSINLSIKDFSLKDDTISGNILKLSANERCGLAIKSFSTNVMFCPSDIVLDDLLIDLNESHLDLDLEFKHNDGDDFNRFVDSVILIANIRDTYLKLSDIRFWSEVMNKMPDALVLNTDFYGIINDFKVENFDVSFGECSNIKGDVSIKGIARQNFNASYWIVDLPNLVTSYDDLVNFYIPSSTVTIPLPEILKPIGKTSLSVGFKGTPANFDFNTNVKTEIGNVDADLVLKRDAELPIYEANIATNDLDLTDVVKMKDPAKITMSMDLKGAGFDSKHVDLKGLVNVESMEIMKNKFENFNIDLSMKDAIAKVVTKISNPDISLKLNAAANLNDKKPVFSAMAKIKNANIPGLHLVETDSVMMLSTNLDVKFSGFDIEEVVADVKVDSLSYYNGDKYFVMNHFDAVIDDNKGLKSSKINCDFFDFEVDGIIHFGTLVNAVKNSVMSYVRLPGLRDESGFYEAEKQEFAMKLHLKKTDGLTKFFMPKIHIAQGTSLTGTFTTEGRFHGQDLDCPELRIGDVVVKDIGLRNSADKERFISEFTVRDLIFRDSTEKHPYRMALENISINTTARNDSMFVQLNWDNHKEKERDMSDISIAYVPRSNTTGGMYITAKALMLADTLLVMDDNCNIELQEDRTVIDNFCLHTKYQAIKINGVYPNRSCDTINVSFHRLDLSDLNVALIGKDIELDGVINGDVTISGLKEQLSFESSLRLGDMIINDKYVGDVSLDSYWNDPDQSITIDADITGKYANNKQKKTFELFGNYYPLNNNDNLRIKMNVNEFGLNSIEPFVKSIIGRLDGNMSGAVDIYGSLAKPVLNGYLAIKDAGCRINFLNTYYKINDTITLSENRIDFNKLSLMDTIGNKAFLHGCITHNYLKDFNMDLRMTCNDFVAMNIPQGRTKGFYGSAVADGTVEFDGPLNDILLDIDVATRRGTEINIPLSGSSSVDNNFIVFVDKNIKTDTVDTFVPELKKTNGMTLNLNAEVNPDAKLNIFLPSNMGKIHASGTGNVNIGMKSGDFNLKGDYVINSGQFAFRLQVVSRNFNIRKGGTIRFNGNPTDADIDIVAVYRTKASLKTIVDSTLLASNGSTNVNVDCKLHLQNKLMNPTITFGIELPNVNDEIKTLVFSTIDTTNQTVMAQHVLSLMVVGMFANTGTANIVNIGTTATYGVITSQLNNWLSQMTKDFDIGINYKPNDNYTNEEIEVAMSTQLFDDRLTIEGNFGMVRGSNVTNNANNIVGDVDVSFKLTNRLSLKAYNHTNVNNTVNMYSFENLSDYTQGVGISLGQSFDRFKEIFMKQKKDKKVKNSKDSENKKDKKDKKNKKGKKNNKEKTDKEDEPK